jgi:hypothetical protein
MNTNKKYLLLSLVLFIITLLRIFPWGSSKDFRIQFEDRIAALSEKCKTITHLPEKKQSVHPCFLYHFPDSLYKLSFPDSLQPNLVSPQHFLYQNYTWDTLANTRYNFIFRYEFFSAEKKPELANMRALYHINKHWKGFCQQGLLYDELTTNQTDESNEQCVSLINYVFDSLTFYEIGTVKYEIISYVYQAYNEPMKMTRSYYMNQDTLRDILTNSNSVEDFDKRLSAFDYTKNFR